MSRWAIVYNPISGSFRPERLEAVRRTLRGEGVETVALPSEYPGHAVRIAREIAGVERVAAYGGDGNLREVAVGLMGRELPLVFLPGGTANSMARELGIGKDPVQAARAALRGAVRPVHPGLLDADPFLLMAGIGFDAMAVHLVSSALKPRLGALAYVLSGFQALVHRHPQLRVQTGDRERRSRWVVGARAMSYAGFMKIHPSAGLTRPALGLTAVNGWMLVPFGIGRLLLRLPVRGPGLVLEERASFRVLSDVPVHAQLDGDYLRAATAFRVSISETAVQFCFPHP